MRYILSLPVRLALHLAEMFEIIDDPAFNRLMAKVDEWCG